MSFDFIEVYEGALNVQECARIIKIFESSGQAQPGHVGGGVYPELKDSRDIQISGKREWQEIENRLNSAMLTSLVQYVRKYPYTLIAPVMLQQPDASGTPQRLSAQSISQMDDSSIADLIRIVLRPGSINIQKYDANRGGYPYWHCELYPKDDSAETLHRHLLWSVYLNEDFDEGETEFHYQGRKITPKTGNLLIAPTAFTHTHRGNKPVNGDKFIATSWILMQRAEILYCQNPAG